MGDSLAFPVLNSKLEVIMFLGLLPMPDIANSSSGPVWAILGIVIGVILTGAFQWITVNRKINADRKRHREDKWWNLKFDSFIELREILSEMYKFDEDRFVLSIGEVQHRLNSFGFRQLVLFNDDSLNKHIADALEMLRVHAEEGGTELNEEFVVRLADNIVDSLEIIEKSLSSF